MKLSGLFAVLLATLLFSAELNAGTIGEFLQRTHLGPKAAYGYAIASAAALTSVATFLFWQNRLLRVAFAIFFSLGTGIEVAINLASGVNPVTNGLNPIEIREVVRIAVGEPRDIPNALAAYVYVSWPIALVAGMIVFAAWLRPQRTVLTSAFALAVPVACLAGYWTLLQPWTSARIHFFVPFHYLSIAAKTLTHVEAPNVQRDAPPFLPAPGQITNKIVLIMDESIRSDYLTINNTEFDTTPFLAAQTGSYFNFGTATPLSNCSSSTRLGIRSGFLSKDLPDRNRRAFRKPTFWQFAKQAGYRTVHIDAFARGPGILYSFMTKQELAMIDEKRLLTATQPERDNEVALLLKEYLARPEPMFIYVEKLGSHFPHDGHNTSSGFVYEPVNLDGFSKGLQSKHRTEIRHYLRSLRWRVDTFFEQLWDQMGRQDAVFIYTADHGQNMFEGKSVIQHCTSKRGSTDGVARVPLLLATGHGQVRAQIQNRFESWKGRSKHDAIFPTLLRLMNYRAEDVIKSYGDSLFDLNSDPSRRYIAQSLFEGQVVDLKKKKKKK